MATEEEEVWVSALAVAEYGRPADRRRLRIRAATR